MPILALGISHRAASIDLLERLTFTGEDLVKAYRRAEDLTGLDEAVVLSTCNRVEVYGAVEGYHPGFVSLKRLLSETRSVGEEELSSPLYAHWERDAAEHLFAVAGGLDSMVLGETQIQAQVRDALRVARSEGAAGSVLTGLFHAATRTGRRIRRETSLGAAPDALVEVAIDLAGERLGGPGRSAVVVGAGTMAGLVVRHLRRRGVGRVMVLNRSLERARTLAARASADAGDLEALPDALAEADLVVSATGATGIVVGAGALRGAGGVGGRRGAGRGRPRRPAAARRDAARRGVAARTDVGGTVVVGRCGTSDRRAGGATVHDASPRRRARAVDPSDPSPRRRDPPG